MRCERADAEHRAQRVEPVEAAVEREPRLERELCERGVAGRDIRRIADDQIEALVRERGEPVRLDEAHG